jgi:hypothetical protein
MTTLDQKYLALKGGEEITFRIERNDSKSTRERWFFAADPMTHNTVVGPFRSREACVGMLKNCAEAFGYRLAGPL